MHVAGNPSSSHPLLQEGAGGGPPKGGKQQQPHKQNLDQTKNKTDQTDAPSVPVRQLRTFQRVYGVNHLPVATTNLWYKSLHMSAFCDLAVDIGCDSTPTRDHEPN